MDRRGRPREAPYSIPTDCGTLAQSPWRRLGSAAHEELFETLERTQIYEGTNQVQRVVMARRLLS